MFRNSRVRSLLLELILEKVSRHYFDIKMFQSTYIIPPLKLLPPSFPFALGLGLACGDTFVLKKKFNFSINEDPSLIYLGYVKS